MQEENVAGSLNLAFFPVNWLKEIVTVLSKKKHKKNNLKRFLREF